MQKIKLFQTVADLHSKGKVDLTASERNLIERETADLIRKSQQYRTAMKAPEGFGDLLLDLSKMDADEAYARVVDFMDEAGIEVETEEEGELEEKEEEGGIEDKLEDKFEDELEDKGGGPKGLVGPKELPGMGGPMDGPGPDMDDKKPDMDDKKPDMDDKKPDMDDKEPMPGGPGKKDEGGKPKPPMFDKDDDDKKGAMSDDEKDKKEDKKEEDKKEDTKDEKQDKASRRKKLVAQAKGLDLEKKKKKKLEDLDDDDEKKKGQDMVDMGMGTDTTPVQAARSKKIRLRITSSRNLIAEHDELGVLFHAVPKASIKNDLTALKRLANKVYGMIVYEGAEVAARKCGAKLMAGVDDDIETTGGDIPPETVGATEEADFDTKETPDDVKESDDVTDDAEFDAQETPDKVEGGRQVARYKRLSGVEDDAEVVTELKPEPMPDKSTDGEDDVSQEKPPAVPSDTISDADFDIKGVEANYKKLYQARATKFAAKANGDFVKKFAKCIEIAAARMLHNTDEHPLKAAALDVLTGDNIAFANSEVYDPMDTATATELIELFSAEGHRAFVEHLLNRTADLMEKSPEYLEDVHADLEHLQPIQIQVEQEQVGHQVSARKVASARHAAHEGNVGLPMVSGGSASPKGSNTVKDAIGETKVTRRLGSMGR